MAPHHVRKNRNSEVTARRDYQQMPLPMVCERARRSALWLADDVLRRSLPLPGQLRLRTG